MKSVLDAAIKWRCCQLFLTLHSISCSPTHYSPVAEKCPEIPLGTGGVQEGTHSKSQDVSVTDSYILHTVQRIAEPGGRAGTACLDCGFESRRGHEYLSLECAVRLSGRGLCDGPITRPEVPSVVCHCDRETLERRPRFPRGCRTMSRNAKN
jgi:hypothetical protein